MSKTVDLRTYLVLERAFVRRLQRSWRIQSATIYAKIAQACNDHQWNRARELVTDLDMTEVGTHNREWIQYMLLSCAVFGANMVAKGKPSFVGVGTFDTFLKQVTNNFLMYLENAGTRRVQEEALQSIAEDEAKTKAAQIKIAWDESKHPRDKEGQFASAGGRGGGIGDAMEGAGPEREKWVKLNNAVMDAFDIDYEAKERLEVAEERAARKHTVNGKLMQESFDADPELLEAVKIKQQTVRALVEAEDALKRQEPAMRVEVVKSLADAVAVKMGVDPSLVEVVHQSAREFNVGDKHFTEAGHYNPATGRIQLNAANISYGDATGVKGIMSHEVSHLIYHALKREADAEFQRYLAKALDPQNSDAYTPWFEERFEKTAKTNWSKQVKEEYRAELEKEFPAAAVMAKLSGDQLFSGISEQMVNENGHSAYARSYWNKQAIADRGHTYESAITETVAELTRWMAYPSSWNEHTTPQPSSSWVKLTQAMHKWYGEKQKREKAAHLKSVAEMNETLAEMEKRWAEEAKT